jgi:trans-2,3-dihydro-3-hydroxyanthranilate isomerase
MVALGAGGPPAFLYDVFAAATVGGNAAGVVLLEQPAPERWLQRAAARLAAPTTGFVDLPSARAGQAGVRLFTPTQEIAACGHAAVAVATCLVEVGVWQAGGHHPAVVAAGGRWPLRLHLRSGRLLVELRQRLVGPVAAADGVQAASVLGPARPARGLPPLLAGTGLRHLLLPLVAVAELARLPLDEAGIVAVSRQAKVDTIGVYAVVDAEGATVRVRMRDLCAGIGAVEEPASGTTSAALAFCLAHLGLLRPDRAGLEVGMGVELGRPSRLEVRLEFDSARPTLARVLGSARRVASAHLRPPVPADRG